METAESCKTQVPKRWWKPQLLWKENDKPFQDHSDFLKRSPKYFGRQSFDFRILQSHPVFTKMKRLKTVNRLTVTHKKNEELEGFPFQTLQIKSLLRHYSNGLRDLQKGTSKTFKDAKKVTCYSFNRESTPPYFLQNSPKLERLSLDHLNITAAKYPPTKRLSIILDKKMKEVLSSADLLKRMMLGASRIRSLQYIELRYFFSQTQAKNELFLKFLTLWNQAASRFRENQNFSLKIDRYSSSPDLPVFQPEFPPENLLIFTKITHLTMNQQLAFFLKRLGDFENLVFLSIDLNIFYAPLHDLTDVRLLFNGLKKLKKLKSLALKLTLQHDTDAKDMLSLMNSFYIPETIEELSLHLTRIKWFLIVPVPYARNHDDFYLPDTNPILESPKFKDFLSKFTELESLRSFSFSTTDGWNIQYTLNKYLFFAIVSNIPKLFQLEYNYFIHEDGFPKEPSPPMDLFMLFESIQHHLPYLTTLVIDDYETVLKKNLDKISISMPNLNNFVLDADLEGTQALCKLPKLLTSQENTQLKMKISQIKMKDEKAFLALFEALKKTPQNSKLEITVDVTRISKDLLEEQLLAFLKTNKNDSVILELFMKKIDPKLFDRVKKSLEQKSVCSLKFIMRDELKRKIFDFNKRH